MTESSALQSFVVDALTDLGAEVTVAEGLVWVRAPESVGRDLEVPRHFALTFDPSRGGEFDAELVAPGSYFLERLLAVAQRRGRWDVARVEPADGSWVREAIQRGGLPNATVDVIEAADEALLVFTFRVTLASDEKRESLRSVAVSTADGSVWTVDLDRVAATVGASMPGFRPTIGPAYVAAKAALTDTTRGEVEGFRAKSLSLLEEEVRRIFGYFDRTMEEIRAADSDGAEDVIRAVGAERDRRLTEALERFEPKARASLCSVQAIVAPAARVRAVLPDGFSMDVRVDGWSQKVRGLECANCARDEGPWSVLEGRTMCPSCAATQDASARPRGRPPSDTPRRGRRAAPAAARSLRGPRARSRAASARRRGR